MYQRPIVQTLRLESLRKQIKLHRLAKPRRKQEGILSVDRLARGFWGNIKERGRLVYPKVEYLVSYIAIVCIELCHAVPLSLSPLHNQHFF